jgi:transcriptional regulator
MPVDRSLEVLHGTLDVLVLKALSWRPMHGYAVSRWIHEHSNGAFELEDAALYKSLHRLERTGAVASEWGLSETRRKAKYYRLTPRGRSMLNAESATWRRYAAAVFAILNTK